MRQSKDVIFIMQYLQGLNSVFFAIFIGLVFIIFINRFKLKDAIHNWRTQRCLSNLGLDQIHNLSCPDGLDSFFSIDRLILLDHSILIVNYKKYPGKIFASEAIDDWTQMLGQKSFKFPNPLFNLSIQLQSLQKCIPDIPIEACIFFDSSAEFPKGMPKQVFLPSHIEERFFYKTRHKVNPDVMKAWSKLQKMAHN